MTSTVLGALILSLTAAPQVVSFDGDEKGAPAADFEAVVGDWSIAEVGGAKGLYVDGSRWRQGQPSASLADQARRLYGDRYAEFLDGVKAFAFFPLAVFKGHSPEKDLELSVRFYPQAGRIDQGAGLAWSIAPDGSYWGTRANALEENLLFFKVVRGKRSVLQVVRGVHTSTRTWHTLRAVVHGKKLTVWLDADKKLERDIPDEAIPKGRCGLWSKADSQVLFKDFTVGEPADATPAPATNAPDAGSKTR